MSEFNMFLDEWKAIRTTQETILRRLDEQEQKNRKSTTKKTAWLSGGLLTTFLVIGILIGIVLNTHAQIKSVPYAVSSQKGCFILGGQWQEADQACVFMARK